MGDEINMDDVIDAIGRPRRREDYASCEEYAAGLERSLRATGCALSATLNLRDVGLSKSERIGASKDSGLRIWRALAKSALESGLPQIKNAAPGD